MAIVIIFLLGIVDFAVHRAVLECGHPMLTALPRDKRLLGAGISMAFEFVVLVAMLWAASAVTGTWALAYVVYSVLNGFAAWLIIANKD